MSIQSGRKMFRDQVEHAAAPPETQLAARENTGVDRGRIIFRRSRSGDESVLREHVEYVRSRPADDPTAA